MREALRRALWIVPTLFLVSVLAFWAATRNAPAPRGEEGLPLLLNERPLHVASLTWSAATTAAGEGPESARARALLVRLGGAALPHLLPRFDALSPPERRRVALGLMPIARRMQIAEVEGVSNGEQAEAFWLDFWQNHFVDFRPTVSQRAVSRFADRATPLRREELLRLDTFALEELVEAMGTERDLAVLQRLFAASAHVAEKPWTLREGASQDEARRVVDTWQAWWARHASKYTEPVGAERLLAPVLQTRYGLWLREAVRTRLGVRPSGEPILTTLQRTAVSTLSLLLLGLIGGSVVGLLLSTLLLSTLQRTRSESRWTRGVAALALGWLGIPTVTWIAWVQTGAPFGPRAEAALLVLASGTAVALLHARAGNEAAELPVATAPPLLDHLGAVAPRALRGIAANASTLLGTVFLVEYGLDLKGWGNETLTAIARRDVPWLMAIAMATAIVLGLVHVAVAIGQQLSLRRTARARER